MKWDRAQKALIGLSLFAAGIGAALLWQVLSKPSALSVRQVRTVAIDPPMAEKVARTERACIDSLEELRLWRAEADKKKAARVAAGKAVVK